VICPEEEDTILVGSSIESAEENMLLSKQLLLLLVLKYCLLDLCQHVDVQLYVISNSRIYQYYN
jgi:hypothetical protein